MQNDFKHVNDVDRVLRDRNREIDIFVEKKVKHAKPFVDNTSFTRANENLRILKALPNDMEFHKLLTKNQLFRVGKVY